jgi:hypothetical protein
VRKEEERSEEGGGAGRRRSGYRTKNKNPTRQCGEQLHKTSMFFQRKVSEHPLRSAATRPAPCGVRFLPTVARPTRPRSPPAQLGKSSSSHRLTTGMMSYHGFA